jgi:hypothetical protein
MYNIDYNRFFQYAGSEMIVNNLIGEVTFPPLYIVSNPYRAMGASMTGFAFFPGKLNIQIIYTSGFLDNEIPIDFSQSVAKWAAGQLLRSAGLRISDGLKSKVIAGVQESYGVYLEVGEKYISEAKQALLRYRRIYIV